MQHGQKKREGNIHRGFNEKAYYELNWSLKRRRRGLGAEARIFYKW